MTIKYDRFVNALRKLCIEHGVGLSAEHSSPEHWGAHPVEVRDLQNGEDPIHNGLIADITTQPVPPVPRDGMVLCDNCSTYYQGKRFDYCPYCHEGTKE